MYELWSLPSSGDTSRLQDELEHLNMMRGIRIYLKKNLTSRSHHQIDTLVLQLITLRERDRMHDLTTKVPNTIYHCFVFSFLEEC